MLLILIFWWSWNVRSCELHCIACFCPNSFGTTAYFSPYKIKKAHQHDWKSFSLGNNEIITSLRMDTLSLRNVHRNSKHLESKSLLCTQLLYSRSFIHCVELTLHFLVNWGAWLECPTWLIYSSLHCKRWLDKETLTSWEVLGQSAAQRATHRLLTTDAWLQNYLQKHINRNCIVPVLPHPYFCTLVFIFLTPFSEAKTWFILNGCPIKHLKSNNIKTTFPHK